MLRLSVSVMHGNIYHLTAHIINATLVLCFFCIHVMLDYNIHMHPNFGDITFVSYT